MIKGPVYCEGCSANVANTIVYELPNGYLCDECVDALQNQDGIAVASMLPERQDLQDLTNPAK